MGVPKFPELGLSRFWGRITLCVDLWSKWSLKQICSSRLELSNSMSHTTWKQGNQGDSQLLVVGNQIVNLTPSPFFGHNLCFKCPNGSCKPFLDIFVPRAFQWYKELFNPMGFDPYNGSLKIRESIETLTPKMAVDFEVWRFNFHTLPYSQSPGSMKCNSRASFLDRTFASLCLGCEPKVRVATTNLLTWGSI